MLPVRDDALLDLPKSMHFPELPPAVKRQGCAYVITWEQRGDVIVAKETCGSHAFLAASRQYVFFPGQGYVGRNMMVAGSDSSDYDLLPDISAVDFRMFLRKQAALRHGISSILFVRRSRQLVELGYDKLSRTDWSLPLLLINQRLASQFQSPIFLDASLDDAQLSIPFARSLSENSPAPVSRGTNRAPQNRSKPPSCSHAGAEFAAQPDCEAPVGTRCVSVGSVGHPLMCQRPCKYVMKKQGCYQGESCQRCHLCKFTNAADRMGKALPA